MSNGENENLNETENSTTSETTQADTGSENTTQTETSEKANNFIATLLALKESNPKVFFGGIAAVVVLILVIIMSSGSSKNIPEFKQTPITIGNEYKLKGANATAPEATVRLVAVPGSMAAYDDTEEADRSPCKNLPQGTRVKVLQKQAAYGNQNAFIQVEILEGQCKGQKGWALGIDLK